MNTEMLMPEKESRYNFMPPPVHTCEYFGKRVEVFASTVDLWCVVYHPTDGRTATWRMPKGTGYEEAAEKASRQTTEYHYDAMRKD